MHSYLSDVCGFWQPGGFFILGMGDAGWLPEHAVIKP
jgi:hypothetical protein